jgi:hypothetical protein
MQSTSGASVREELRYRETCKKQFETKKKITPDIVENRLVELKKVFVKQKKDVNLPINHTPQDPDSFTVLRVRNQQWRTGYEARLKKLPMNFRGKQSLYLGEGVRYPTFAEFEYACQAKDIPLV